MDDYLIDLRANMGLLQETVRDAIQREGEAMKARFDIRTKADPSKLLRVGEKVCMVMPPPNSCAVPKLEPSLRGPFRVVAVTETSAVVQHVWWPAEIHRVQQGVLRRIAKSLESENFNTKKQKTAEEDLKNRIITLMWCISGGTYR